MVEQGELLPCPMAQIGWCKGGPLTEYEGDSRSPAYIRCEGCKTTKSKAALQDARAAWNARSTAPVRTAPVLEGELLPVIQDDREAAADMVEDLDRFASGLLRASRIRRGELDDSPEVGAIAAHRLCHSTDFERENAVYTSDGDPVRLGVQAAECDAAADLIEQLQARLAEAEGLAQQAHDALDAMMRTWLDYHDAHSLTDPMTGASGNAFDKALDARDAAASWLAGR